MRGEALQPSIGSNRIPAFCFSVQICVMNSKVVVEEILFFFFEEPRRSSKTLQHAKSIRVFECWCGTDR